MISFFKKCNYLNALVILSDKIALVNCVVVTFEAVRAKVLFAAPNVEVLPKT